MKTIDKIMTMSDNMLWMIDEILSISRLWKTGKPIPSQLKICAGYSVHVAETGAAAMGIIGQGGVDAVLLDHKLPDAAGLELLETIAAKYPDLPVVMVTGHGDERLAADVMKAGAVDYVIKDMESRFVATLPKIIERVSRQRVLEKEKALLVRENARLAIAVQRVGEGIVITDGEGIIEYMNPAYEEITGYRLAEVRGLTPRVLKSGRQDSAFYEDMWKTIKAGRVWRGNIISRKKDGTLYEEKMTISPIADTGGPIATFGAVKHDITDEEAALQKARKYFTVITAHELRTPLTMLKLLKSHIEGKRDSRCGPDDIKLELAIINDACGALDDIVAATSLIADLHRPRRDKDFTNVYLLIELKAVLGITENLFKKEKRDIRLTADLDAWPRELKILGNRNMVSKMMDNILSNAVKYTPDGRAVRAAAKLENGFAVLEVSDEGIGIPGDRMQAVFEPYFSLENVNHHSTGRYKFMGGGIGLGLTVSRLIMEYHGGGLTVDSPGENRGTNVTLRFPLDGTPAPEA